MYFCTSCILWGAPVLRMRGAIASIARRGVAMIFGLGGRPCRVEPDPASTEVAKPMLGGLGPPPEEFCCSECLKCIFPASGTITITYRTMKFNNLHLYLSYSSHCQSYFFMGLLRKMGDFFCHPLLWGGHLPPTPL